MEYKREELIALMREMEKQIALCHIRPQLAGALADELERSEPVVHGRWNGWHGDKMVAEDEYRHYHYYSCNKCGRKSAVNSNYCPNCGARMDGE